MKRPHKVMVFLDIGVYPMLADGSVSPKREDTKKRTFAVETNNLEEAKQKTQKFIEEIAEVLRGKHGLQGVRTE